MGQPIGMKNLASSWLDSYERNQSLGLFTTQFSSLNMEEAYSFQRDVVRLREARGDQRAGYKVGCLSPAIRNQLKLHQPVIGYLWQSEKHISGDSLSAGEYTNLAIEGELALEVPPEHATSWRCYLVMELHNLLEKVTAQALVASNAMHAGIVFHPDVFFDVENGKEPSDLPISIEINETEVASGFPKDLPGGIFGSLGFLERNLASRGERLKSGDWVLCGAPTPLVPVIAGNRVAVRYGRHQLSINLIA